MNPCARRYSFVDVVETWGPDVEETGRRAMEAVLQHAQPGRVEASGVDVHFHSDSSAGGVPILAALLSGGAWRTQFETGTGDGGLTAHPGGDRWRWESDLSAGAYDDAPSTERPVYGGLRITERPYGSAPRFGSAHLRLRSTVLPRVTLCYPDSAYSPQAVGTVEAAGAVVAALGTRPMDDPLDRYVEAHVHGGVDLDDAESVVPDPSFRGTTIDEIAREGRVPVRWHPGYALAPSRLRRLGHCRGEEAIRVGLALAGGAVLTPARLARARASDAFDPQMLKWVWHLLAAFGRQTAA